MGLPSPGPGPGVIVTSSRDGRVSREELAALARELGTVVVPRDDRPWPELLKRYGAQAALVLEKDGLVLRDAAGTLFFHPGMAHVRIKRLREGQSDRMVAAMDLSPGMTVLDCTLGLGADAIVAAYAVGSAGRVAGLEACAPLAALVRYGLTHYRGGTWLSEAMGRIEVAAGDHRRVLPRLPDGSYDVVYFDPMFRRPLVRSSGMAPLRHLVETAPLDPRSVAEALRVARRRVVLKERRDSAEFARLGFIPAEGGRYSPVAFGVRKKERGETA